MYTCKHKLGNRSGFLAQKTNFLSLFSETLFLFQQLHERSVEGFPNSFARLQKTSKERKEINNPPIFLPLIQVWARGSSVSKDDTWLCLEILSIKVVNYFS